MSALQKLRVEKPHIGARMDLRMSAYGSERTCRLERVGLFIEASKVRCPAR